MWHPLLLGLDGGWLAWSGGSLWLSADGVIWGPVDIDLGWSYSMEVAGDVIVASSYFADGLDGSIPGLWVGRFLDD